MEESTNVRTIPIVQTNTPVLKAPEVKESKEKQSQSQEKMEEQ